MITESGGTTTVIESAPSFTDTYQVALSTMPTAPVFITVSAGGAPSEEAAVGAKTILVSTDGIHFVDAAVLRFDAATWNVPQTVSVRAADDTVQEGERLVVVSHSSRSADASFDHLAVRDVRVTVQDDDKPGIKLTQTGASTLVLEGSLTTTPTQGIEDTYDVSLTRAPAPGTTVTVTLIPDPQITLTQSALAFTSANCLVASRTS